MKVSKLLLPVLKKNPNDASIASHRLMLRAGMIRQITSGIYAWLPLGLRVLKKIENIVRQNHNRHSAQEIIMPCIQPVELWQQSGRFGNKEGDLSTQMLLMEDRHHIPMVFAPTAEEVVCKLFKENIHSYKELPLNLYQIQWKFRDEIRPRFGVMRCREFLMKDAYSFHINQEDAHKEYHNMMRCYLNIFSDIGLNAIPVLANTGSIGGDLSHEFHVLANTGESKIFYDKNLEQYLIDGNITLEGLNKYYAMEEEKHDPTQCPVSNDQLLEKRGIEVGHIFYLGDKYSKKLGLQVQNADGKLVTPVMGTYGIGVSRLVGAVIEASHDINGIIWPQSIAPYDVVVINLKPQDKECSENCEQIIQQLTAMNYDVLYEDTNCSAGEKFSTMDLIGIPYQIILGPQGLSNKTADIKTRTTGEKQSVNIDSISAYFHNLLQSV